MKASPLWVRIAIGIGACILILLIFIFILIAGVIYYYSIPVKNSVSSEKIIREEFLDLNPGTEVSFISIVRLKGSSANYARVRYKKIGEDAVEYEQILKVESNGLISRPLNNIRKIKTTP